MKLQRREFLRRTALGVSGLLIGAPRAAASGASPTGFDPYARVPLGKTPLEVSRFCLGTGTRGSMRQSNHTRLGKEKLEALIRDSFDRGTRLFDLARRDAPVRFALTLGCVDVLNVGCESIAEVDDIAARVRRVEQPKQSITTLTWR